MECRTGSFFLALNQEASTLVNQPVLPKDRFTTMSTVTGQHSVLHSTDCAIRADSRVTYLNSVHTPINISRDSHQVLQQPVQTTSIEVPVQTTNFVQVEYLLYNFKEQCEVKNIKNTARQVEKFCNILERSFKTF